MKKRIWKIVVMYLVVISLSACGTESSKQMIEMPYDSEDYCGQDWTYEELKVHLQELGFTNIREVPFEPNEDNYRENIYDIVIETGAFSDDPWKAGERYASDAEISVYYNEEPLLTVDTCPELLSILTSEELDYLEFAEKYDGRYVEFNGYVHEHLTYMGDTGHVIEVAYGDGVENDMSGHIIYIGDRTWGNAIDESVEVGDLVSVSGKFDLSWSEYHKMLYVECRALEKR